MGRLNVWPWLRPFLILVLAISIPPAVYWFGYVQSSVAAAKQQAYSTLSAVTADFKVRLEAYDGVAENALPYAREGLPAQRLTDYLNSILRLQPKLKTVSPITAPEGAPRLQVDSQAGGLLMTVRKSKASTDAWQASIALENLIPWSVVETEFDGLVVLSEQRELLAQDRRLPVQPLAVPVALRLGSDGADPGMTLVEPGSAGAKASQPATGTARTALFAFAEDASVRIAGVDYVAFVQTVKIPGAPGAKGAASNRVLVCGLIAKERLRREAIQLGPQTLVLFSALIAFGLFAIPFLKLRFIGERERMQRRDIWLLGASILSATALIALVMLDGHALVKLQQRFDAGLKQFSQEMTENLQSETNAAIGILRASVPQLLSDAELKIPADTTPFKCEYRSSALAPGEPLGAVLTRKDLHTYPDIEAIVATDLCGNQIRKWMARTLPTAPINLSGERYFVPALTLTRHSQAAGADDFAFGITRAPTSGLQLGIYATPLDGNTRKFGMGIAAEQRTGIVAIATPMRSLAAPIIARPFQFVLVDRRGEVTFQKAEGSFARERFFEAVRGGDALERAARAGDSGPRTYEYRGKPYRMSARDIPDLQLTLVTYYDANLAGMLAARAFATAAFFGLGIIGAMLVGGAGAALIFRERAFDWIWPSTRRSELYTAGAIICVLAMLALWVAKHVMPSKGMPWMLLGVPAGTIALLGSGRVTAWLDSGLNWIRFFGFKPAPPSFERMLPRYKAFAVAALVALIAWPVTVAFSDALNLHATAYASLASSSWRAAFARWNDANMDGLVNVGTTLAEPDCTSKADLRCRAPEPVYASDGNYTALLEKRRKLAVYDSCAPLAAPEVECDIAKPPETPFSFTADFAAPLARFGREGPENGRILASIAESQSGPTSRPSAAEFGDLLWSIAGGLLLFVTLWRLVASIAKHVLGIELVRSTSLDESKAVEKARGSRWLLLRPSEATMQALRESPPSDLRSLQLPYRFSQPAAEETLVVEHLEARLSTRQWRMSLLALLEAPSAGCVILSSEIEPLFYLTQRAREKGDYLASLPADEKEKRAAADKACNELRNEIARWAAALRDVRKIRRAPPGFRPPPPTSPCPDLHARLAVECGSDELLVEIGERLLAREGIGSYCWSEIVSFVLDGAEAYYRAIWELCSREERLVLLQLAQAGLVNPKHKDIMRRLARRGLVVLEPRFRLMNDSFERFVCSAEPPERIAEWERTGSSVSWSRFGTPLYALAAMLIAVLLFAEQAHFSDLIAVATGGAVTLGSLRSLYTSVTKTASEITKPA